MGPSINSPGHRLYNITTKRVIISRNVLFDELTLGLPEDTPQQHQHDVAQLQVEWTLPTALPYIQLPGIQPVAASEVQDFTNLDWEDDIISANTQTTTVDIPSDPREDSNEIPALSWTEAQLNPALEVLPPPLVINTQGDTTKLIGPSPNVDPTADPAPSSKAPTPLRALAHSKGTRTTQLPAQPSNAAKRLNTTKDAPQATVSRNAFPQLIKLCQLAGIIPTTHHC